MAEVVDSIIAELIARDNNYVATFDRASAAHERFGKTADALKAQTFDLNAEGQKYKAGANTIASAEEQATQRVARTRKARADSSIADDARATASAKKAAKDQADAQIAEAQRSARYSAMAQRAMDRASAPIQRSSSNRIGASLPREQVAPLFIPQSYLNDTGAASEVTPNEKVDELTRDIALNKARLAAAEGEEKNQLEQEIVYLETIARLKRSGVAETEAIVLAEAAVVKEQEKQAAASALAGGKSSIGKKALQFGEGAGIGRSYGSIATVAGLATAATIGAGIEATSAGISYATQLADTATALGLTTKQLQVYQEAARGINVDNTKLQSSFSSLANAIGRAQEGDKALNKIFGAGGLNIDISSFKSVGDAIPTIIDRISQIPDATKRAAYETRLFGEAGRQLDPLLSGGAAAVAKLTAEMEKNGQILSSGDITALKEASVVLADLKNKLSVDLSRVIANNKDAVLGLAQAFASLADKALKALAAFERVKAQRVYDDSKPSSPERQQAFGSLISDPQGRQFLRTRIRSQIGDLRNTPTLTFNGKNDEATRDAYIKQQGATLLKQYGQVLFYKDAQEATPAVEAGKVGNGKPFAPDAPKGKSAATLDREALQRRKQFQDQLSSFQDEQLRAEEEASGDINKRADIEKQLADESLKKLIGDKATGTPGDIDIGQQRDIDAGEDPAVARQRADALKAAAQKAHDAQVSNIDQQRQTALTQQGIDTQTLTLQAQIDFFDSQLELAKTAKQRRTIELNLLDLATEQQRLALERKKADLKPDDAKGLADVNAQLAQLPVHQAQQTAIINQRDAGPLKTYLDQLPRTADQLNDALEQAAAGGLQSLDDGLTSVVAKFLHLNGLAGSFLQSLIKIGIEREALIPIANYLFPTGDSNSGVGGGFLGTIAKLLGGGGGGAPSGGGIDSIIAGGDLATSTPSLSSLITALPHFAKGGSIGAGTLSVVGENGPELFQPGVGGTIIPNINTVPTNLRVAPSAPQVTVVAPLRFDLSQAVMTPELLQQMNQISQYHAYNYAAAMGGQAVKTANAQAPGTLASYQQQRG